MYDSGGLQHPEFFVLKGDGGISESFATLHTIDIPPQCPSGVVEYAVGSHRWPPPAAPSRAVDSAFHGAADLRAPALQAAEVWAVGSAVPCLGPIFHDVFNTD